MQPTLSHHHARGGIMHRLLIIFATTGLLTLATGIRVVSAGPLRAGAATSNITPEIGRDIIGGFVPFPSTHIHDELHARCLVLDDGGTRLAIVVCDLLGIHRLVSDEARRLIAERTNIPSECVMICATHTHSASSALGRDRLKHDPSLDEYQKFVARRIADGVTRAANLLGPAELAIGQTEAPEHVFNRRWSMRPGTVPANPFGGADLVKMNPPAGSPNLVQPAGPVDPTIPFLAVRDADGPLISVFATYSLHYVGGVSQGHVSADYFAIFCDHLAQLLDADGQQPPFVPMLANGTSGDINNINFRTPRPRKPPYEQMRHVGRDVARKVHAAMQNLEYRSEITLSAAYREPVMAWRRPDAPMLEWADATISKGSPAGKRDLPSIYARRVKSLADYPETTPVPLQVLRIGDVCIGTMPCEVFCEIGLEFKRRSPVQPAWLVSLAHGYFGYLPTPRQHQLGGYETWLGTSRLEAHASDKMLDALLEMAAPSP
jgi:hypothetical protein